MACSASRIARTDCLALATEGLCDDSRRRPISCTTERLNPLSPRAYRHVNCRVCIKNRDEGNEMNRVSISIDVPDIAEGVRFYTSAFGFSKASAPVPGVVVLSAGNAEICLLEKRAGSKPSTYSEDNRRYQRHWTPVHLDIHVENLKAALATALAAGAGQEQIFENAEHGSAAFCSDPFGHGFCLIEKAR
jgi:predicted enzyme related to lactoylglutathione lyase